MLKRRQAEIVLGTTPAVNPAKVKVARLLDLVLADYEANQKSVAWAKYVDGHLRPFFGDMKARAVGTEAIQRYVVHRRAEGVGNSTINREFTLLRRAFQLGLNAEPPLVGMVPRIVKFSEKNTIRKGFFEHEQFIALRTELPEHLRPVITFAYYTGCRKSEILELPWQQVDFERRSVRLEPGETKNEDARTLPLTPDLYDMLSIEKLKRDQSFPSCRFVFSRYGKRIRDFYGAWAEACKRAKLVDDDGKATRLLHDLRRTAVRNMVRAGIPERVAMMISGHKTRSVFERYNIVSEKDLHLAAERLHNYLSAKTEDKYKSSTSSPDSAQESVHLDGPQTSSKLLNLLSWCGEGDLNPHEIAPASTSS